MWAGIGRGGCFVCVWWFLSVSHKRNLWFSYLNMLRHLSCCSFFSPLQYNVYMYVCHCVCGHVRLVSEFIYLILNQPSNSLIGPVPLLGNEGKWAITLVFVGNENVCVCIYVCVQCRLSQRESQVITVLFFFLEEDWEAQLTLSVSDSSLLVCVSIRAGLAVWHAPVLGQPSDVLIGRVIPGWSKRLYFTSINSTCVLTLKRTQWNLAVAGSHDSRRAGHHSSSLICVSFRAVCYINCWSFPPSPLNSVPPLM